MVEEGALFSKQLNIFHGNTIVESLSLSDHWYSCISFIQKVTTQMLHDWVCLPYISYWQYQNTNGKAACSKLDTQQFAGQWVVYYGSQDILYFVLSWWALRGIIRFCKGQILWIVNFFHVHGNLKSWIYLSNPK